MRGFFLTGLEQRWMDWEVDYEIMKHDVRRHEVMRI